MTTYIYGDECPVIASDLGYSPANPPFPTHVDPPFSIDGQGGGRIDAVYAAIPKFPSGTRYIHNV